jgi:hypothetical protein
LGKDSEDGHQLRKELKKVAQATTYLAANILSSLTIAAAFLLSVFVLSRLAMLLFGSVPPIIDTLLEFSSLEGLIIFVILFISNITVIPKVLKRIHEQTEKGEGDSG